MDAFFQCDDAVKLLVSSYVTWKTNICFMNVIWKRIMLRYIAWICIKICVKN